jgi:hypothetical protein
MKTIFLKSIALVVLVVGGAQVALAGPPLICQRIDIGNAQTLPNVDLNYHRGSNGYDLKNLTRDTLAILDANAGVLVRMETLRRATLYARQDPTVAKELMSKLYLRAQGSNTALAWFDAGYLAESYKVWIGRDEPNPAAGLDGYGWVKKAIQLSGGDAQMEYAAALITLRGPAGEHREYVQKAMDGAKRDALLARNLSAQFHNESMAALLSKPAAD